MISIITSPVFCLFVVWSFIGSLQLEPEVAALTNLALHAELRSVEQENVLDYRKSESRSDICALVEVVHLVVSLPHHRELILGYADSVVYDFKKHLAVLYRLPDYYGFVLSGIVNGVSYSSIAAAARLPAPIARITVAAPVTASPPANTPSLEVMPCSSSATMQPLRLVSRPGVV